MDAILNKYPLLDLTAELAEFAGVQLNDIPVVSCIFIQGKKVLRCVMSQDDFEYVVALMMYYQNLN